MMAAMVAFVDRNETDGNKMIAASRGEQRLQYLARYSLFQAKQKAGEFATTLTNFKERKSCSKKGALRGGASCPVWRHEG